VAVTAVVEFSRHARAVPYTTIAKKTWKTGMNQCAIVHGETPVRSENQAVTANIPGQQL
jgi:hypothetical protein